MKTLGEWQQGRHAFLNSALHRGEWSASRPGIHWIGSWVDPRTGMDTAVEKREIISPCRESNPSRPARNLVTKLTELL